jgi:hypothetical protein
MRFDMSLKLIENWADVLWKSLSLWCLYIAGIAVAVHETIAKVPHGIIPDDLIAKADGISVAVAFICVIAAIPARVIQQVSLSQRPPPP